MRLTGEIGRFYTDLLPYLKEVNIIVMSINHIKVNPQMGIVKSPAELLYLKQDEALDFGAVYRNVYFQTLLTAGINSLRSNYQINLVIG